MFYTLNKLKYNIQVRLLYYFYQTIITFKLLEKKLLLTNRWLCLADFLDLEWVCIMILHFVKIETLK